MTKFHLDTDLGGDPDDAFALAMLLGWPDVEITGITTTCDRGGIRAAYVHHLLDLVGRQDIPVAAGAETTISALAFADPIIDDERHWPTRLRPAPSPPGEALNLLGNSIDQGATIIGIGSLTNLAVLEVFRAGSLSRAPVVAMGGWIAPPSQGLPQWGPEKDWNIQWDTRAAEIVFGNAKDLTLATLPSIMNAHLRMADMPRLRASGPLGELLASQSGAYGVDLGMPKLGRAHTALPDDLLNFHYDPVACAVALGWSGAVVEEVTLRAVWEASALRLEPDLDGRPVRVLAQLDAEHFREVLIIAIETAQN